MEVVGTLVLLFVLIVFIVGLFDVAGALAGQDNTRQHITKQSITYIEQAASEGQKAMDELSEQYLNDLYNQVTRSINPPK